MQQSLNNSNHTKQSAISFRQSCFVCSEEETGAMDSGFFDIFTSACSQDFIFTFSSASCPTSLSGLATFELFELTEITFVVTVVDVEIVVIGNC